MSPRRTGNACQLCGRRCRYGREVCSTCRPVVQLDVSQQLAACFPRIEPYPAGPR